LATRVVQSAERLGVRSVGRGGGAIVRIHYGDERHALSSLVESSPGAACCRVKVGRHERSKGMGRRDGTEGEHEQSCTGEEASCETSAHFAE
jgi:hypothetical protein